MKKFKAKHKDTGLYLANRKSSEYTLSKSGSVFVEISTSQIGYNKKVCLYCGKYTKLYENTYKAINWSETWKPTEMFSWVDLNDFDIEYINE